MAVTIKNSNHSFLLKIGVSTALVERLKVEGISVLLGYEDFYFADSKGKTLSAGVLPVSFNALIKGMAKPAMVTEALQVLETSIKTVLKLGPPKHDPNHSSELIGVAEIKGMIADAVVGVHGGVVELPAGGVVFDVPELPNLQVSPPKAPVALRDAVSLYQKVKGTSSGSVYVVVALSPDVKVAARVAGSNLSVRVEGDLNKYNVVGFTGQGFSAKSNYLSLHFDCTAQAPVDKVLGAVLMAANIEWTSQFPSIQKVVALCK